MELKKLHYLVKMLMLIIIMAKIKILISEIYHFSSIDFTKDLIEAHTWEQKIMPLIHLPVQSGSNKILKKMNRKHSIEKYLDIIKNLKKSNPNIEFSSDFIIGYPGETNEDFESH